MKAVVFLARSLIVLFAALLVGCGSQDKLELASGQSLSLDSLAGQWLVINYWAQWCKPCYEEIPELNALNGDERVQVLGVNYDGVKGSELTKLSERMGIRFPTLVKNPSERFGWSNPIGLPATFIVNPQREVVEARFGPQTRAGLLKVINRRTE